MNCLHCICDNKYSHKEKLMNARALKRPPWAGMEWNILHSSVCWVQALKSHTFQHMYYTSHIFQCIYMNFKSSALLHTLELLVRGNKNHSRSSYTLPELSNWHLDFYLSFPHDSTESDPALPSLSCKVLSISDLISLPSCQTERTLSHNLSSQDC